MFDENIQNLMLFVYFISFKSNLMISQCLLPNKRMLLARHKCTHTCTNFMYIHAYSHVHVYIINVHNIINGPGGKGTTG